MVTVVNTSRVRVRSAPRTVEDTFISWVPRGTQLKRIAKQGNWYHVQLSEGREAWIHGKYAEEGVARDLLEVNVAGANVRESPSTASPKIVAVRRGDVLALDRESNKWYLAYLPDGRRGWIHKNLVTRRRIGPPPEEPVAPPPTEESPQAEVPVEKEPEVPPDHYQQGLDQTALGRFEEAVAAFRLALEADPDDGAVHFELARLLKGQGRTGEALEHFQKALRGNRRRPKASFHIKALRESMGDSTADSEAPEAESTGQDEGLWMRFASEGAVYLLPGLALGSLAFLVALGLLYRRRRMGRTECPVYRRRRSDAGFDAVLEYAVEKRPLVRAIEEAERKRAEMDEALRRRFDTIGKEALEGGPKLPGVEPTEALIKRVEDLRQTILNQEERVQIYADLVVLQNEKIEALDQEIEALKKLIQLNYRDAGKRSKKRTDAGGGSGGTA